MAELTDIAKTVVRNRISLRDTNGTPYEDWNDVCTRVAKAVAKGKPGPQREFWEKKFYQVMYDLDFLPNSPTLCHAGTELGQLAACYVLPVPDSMEGIFEAVKNAALIHKSGGGTGFSFSKLRPAGSTVSSTSGISSGPVSFMHVFDAATAAIKQGGTRRGANMGILNIDHPDIKEFIHMKSDMNTLNNFNISVGMTNEFMSRVKDQGPERELMLEIAGEAWRNGDPGLVFLDAMNNNGSNPLYPRLKIEATNPCGEQPLYPNESCTLGSINLSNFVSHGKIDTDRLDIVTTIAINFLDAVIDVNKYPTKGTENNSQYFRRIGLGVMGYADMLLKLKCKYGTSEALRHARIAMHCIETKAKTASDAIAQTEGMAPYAKEYHDLNVNPRNIALTTIAPTGTISMIAGCSSGIEPVFDWKFTRRHYLDENDPSIFTEIEEVHPLAGKYLPAAELPSYFVKSDEIPVEDHIITQACFQEYVDNAVSKTINLPSSATVQDIFNAYLSAWEKGCKGITVYRDGSRDVQVLTREAAEDMVEPQRRKLPPIRNSVTHRFQVGDQEGYIIVGLYEDNTPGEVFLNVSKQGSTVHGLIDVTATLFSYCLQYGIPLSTLTNKLQGSRFEPSGFTGNSNIPNATSIIDYVSRWLYRQFNQEEESDIIQEVELKMGDVCPDCGIPLVHQDGCEECKSCGWNRC